MEAAVLVLIIKSSSNSWSSFSLFPSLQDPYTFGMTGLLLLHVIKRIVDAMRDQKISPC